MMPEFSIFKDKVVISLDNDKDIERLIELLKQDGIEVQVLLNSPCG